MVDLHKRQTTTARANATHLHESEVVDDNNTIHVSTNKIYSRINVLITLQPARLVKIIVLLLLCAAVPYYVLVTSPASGNPASGSTSTAGSQLSMTASSTDTKSSTASPPLPPTQVKVKPTLPDLTKYEGCTVRTPPSRTEAWTTKPLWFPSYPNSIDDNFIKNLIKAMTGLGAGAKSFYASSKKMGLRQCFGKTETAACMIIHPMVEMKPGPDSKANVFWPDIVFLMRNPVTVMPAFLNGKRIKYAKLPGQQPQDEWRKARDDSLENGLWEGWKKQLHAWKSYNYKVGMYLVHDHLMDAQRGPGVVEKLANLMEKAGFAIAPKEDMGCLWYQSVGGKEGLEHYYRYRYEFEDYLPGFTKEQQAFLLGDLNVLMEQYKDDADLVEILKEFHDNIRDDLQLDEEWVAKGDAST